MLKMSLELESVRYSVPLPNAIEQVAETAKDVIPAGVRLEFAENFERGGIDSDWAEISWRQSKKHENRIAVHGGGGYGYYMILIYTQRLLKSLTEPSHPENLCEIRDLPGGDTEIVMGTKVPYSRYHMTGFKVKRALTKSGRRLKTPVKRRIPARPHIGIATSSISSFTDMILKEI